MDPQQGLGSGFDRRDHLVMNVQLLNSQYPPLIMFRYLKMMLKALLSLASVVNVVGPERGISSRNAWWFSITGAARHDHDMNMSEEGKINVC